ncbi:MAG: hypothetical protein ABI585_11390 [Betaproteobacteria bacterium]
MSPALRIWAIFAISVAAIFALRGAWPLALACFFLSPAPALAFSRGRSERSQASAQWLRVVAIGVAAIVALYAIALAFGGLPPIHEWRAAWSGSAR